MKNDELTIVKHKSIDYYDIIKDEKGKLKYQTGTDVSRVGQKLNSKISSLFMENNVSDNYGIYNNGTRFGWYRLMIKDIQECA